MFPQGSEVKGAPAHSTRARVQGGTGASGLVFSKRYRSMQRSIRKRRRTPLQVESLEGKALLSAGSVMHRVAPHVTAAPIVAQAAAAFSGTLTGTYSSVNVPGFSHVLSYAASGTLSGAG